MFYHVEMFYCVTLCPICNVFRAYLYTLYGCKSTGNKC